MFKLFDAQIVSVLLYGSELWGCFDCPNVEKVHMYACERILDISSKSPNRMVYGELGRHRLSSEKVRKILGLRLKQTNGVQHAEQHGRGR